MRAVARPHAAAAAAAAANAAANAAAAGGLQPLARRGQRACARRITALGEAASSPAASDAPQQQPEELIAAHAAFSEDGVSGDAIVIRQARGPGAYRFSLDALLLATDLPPTGQDPPADARVVEVCSPPLGCLGCGRA